MRGTLLGSLAGVSWLKEAATSTFLVFLFKDSQAQPEPNTCSNNINPKEQGKGGSMCQQGYTAQSLATVASSYSGSSLRELGLELVEGAKLLVNGGAQLARGLAGILARCRHAEPACTKTRGESGGDRPWGT